MSDERLSPLLRLPARARAFCTSPHERLRLAGMLCGLYLLVWCHGFLARWGTSLPVVAGLAAGLTLGWELAWLCSRGRRALSPASPAGPSDGPPEAAERHARAGALRPAHWPTCVLYLGLAAWTVALPGLSDAWGGVVARIPIQALTAPPLTWGICLAGGMALLGLPMFLLGMLGLSSAGLHRGDGGGTRRSASGPDTARERVPVWFGGLAWGLLCGVFLVAPTLGLQVAASAAAVVGAVVAFVQLIRGERSQPADLVSAEPRLTLPTDMPRPQDIRSAVWAMAACAVLGISFAAVQRIAHQLMPAAAYTLAAQCAALLLSAGWAMRGTQRRPAGRPPGSTQVATCLWAAAAIAAVPLGFGLLTDFVLLLNSHVASVWAIMATRSLIAGLLVAPAGACLGVLLARSVPATAGGPHEASGDAATADSFIALRAPFAVFAAGFVLGRLVNLAADAATIASGASVLLGILALVRGVRSVSPQYHWRIRIAGAAACAVPVAAIAFHSGDDPARAARLLFSTDVFLAKQAGLNPDLLTVIDEGRLVAIREGAHGTHTLWKFRGAQYQLRESGVPKAVISSDGRICPQYPPEVMQAVLPLVLHERPSRVLVLGLGGGVPLATCLRFPVLEVACAEGDPGLVGLLQTHVWSAGTRSPLEDERVQPIALDPVLAVTARQRPYDVIVSNADQSGLPAAAACFTAEFYKNAARQLAVDGIFCQRLQAIDYGPMPLAVLARTMQTAFRRVVFIETAAGEYALLGTNSQRGLVRAGLIDRLQASQVRDILAEVGWDWSMVLNLPAYDHESLAGFAVAGSERVNSADSGRFAFTLPQEIMRWAPKTQEIQSRLASRATRLLAWDNLDTDADVLRRLSDVTAQRKLMTTHPDQYWAYRQTVREQITEHPRSLIVPVKGDVVRERHPVDQRRLDYFAALGQAVRNHPPGVDDIRHVAEFAAPFDPLISYFLHEEVAQLYSRLPERDFQAELPHRLHAIYFADGQDRSVRNVAAAIVLLAEHPSAVPDPRARFDHLNGLLQMLQFRWQTRGAVSPRSSRIVLNDIANSIAGVEAAFAALDRLHREAEIPHSHWPARRRYLERTLLRPLRTYRGQVLPHHLKRLRLLESTGEDADAAAVPEAAAPL